MQTPGFAGSWMSHQGLWRTLSGRSHALVLEDDAVPAEDFTERFLGLWADLQRHDPRWQGLWLGYDPNYREMTACGEYLCKHRNPLNTHAYALRGAFRRMATELDPRAAGRSHWDGMLVRLARRYNTYAPPDGRLVSQAVWLGLPDPKDNYEDTRAVGSRPVGQ